MLLRPPMSKGERRAIFNQNKYIWLANDQKSKLKANVANCALIRGGSDGHLNQKQTEFQHSRINYIALPEILLQRHYIKCFI